MNYELRITNYNSVRVLPSVAGRVVYGFLVKWFADCNSMPAVCAQIWRKICARQPILKFFIVFSLSIFNVQLSTVSAQDLVPQPVSVVRGEGTVALLPYPAIDVTDSVLAPLAQLAAKRISARITLSLDAPAHIPAEGYRLEIAPQRITIAGRDYGGVWNGLQTLFQLLTPAGEGPIAASGGGSLPVVTIEDWPALPYRGVMLDVARTFVPKEQVLKLIDDLSAHKINKLHWHLVDDEGWRIEIKKYPHLTEIGAWRGPGTPIHAIYGAWDRRYGGFYTQDEIREVVAHAAVRNVEIIPEIDLPGHSRAAAIAYPSILCDFRPSLVASAGYDTRNVWCVARDENFDMLNDIIAEVAALFPSPVMHLGGDEVSSSQWSQCPHCQQLMRERGLTEARALQDIFMSRVIEIAARHGKSAGVWNEAAASAKIPRSTLVWGWETPAAARKVAANGYPTVFCAGSYFYFDMRQSQRDVGHIWAGVVTLQRVYSFSPAAAGFTPNESANIRGVEATFFSELLLENGLQFLDHQLFPRVCALAEVAWTPLEKRSWSDFQRRMTTHLKRLDAAGINYRSAEPQQIDNQSIKAPAATFTSSLTANSKYPFAALGRHSAAGRTTSAPRTGDWFLWRWPMPVAAREIVIRTGHTHLQRGGVPAGRVEVSYDGAIFETVGQLHDLGLKFTPAKPIRAIKITSLADANGENYTLIQPLIIR